MLICQFSKAGRSIEKEAMLWRCSTQLRNGCGWQIFNTVLFFFFLWHLDYQWLILTDHAYCHGPVLCWWILNTMFRHWHPHQDAAGWGGKWVMILRLTSKNWGRLNTSLLLINITFAVCNLPQEQTTFTGTVFSENLLNHIQLDTELNPQDNLLSESYRLSTATICVSMPFWCVSRWTLE